MLMKPGKEQGHLKVISVAGRVPSMLPTYNSGHLLLRQSEKPRSDVKRWHRGL